MRWFAKRDWAVVIWTGGDNVFGTDSRTHEAMAVQHYPQMNAATVCIGLSRHAAAREVVRLNALNNPNARAMRIEALAAGESA